ncbi:endonuclease [Shewanella inventionis]|uniref:Endonuclease n=1 Tax=Shewanella inventionis TaxID=1738770 RepID=A0ABQ1JDW0_9GAMM|nr:endonuclease [Shewanella inventionis]GGB66468.1 endonuclease [Shewanella inventionis]
MKVLAFKVIAISCLLSSNGVWADAVGIDTLFGKAKDAFVKMSNDTTSAGAAPVRDNVSIGVGNTTNDSFNKAKKMLMKINQAYPYTIYCGAKFDQRKNIELPQGMVLSVYKKRNKLEFEHVAAAQNLGQAFSEWREGHALCVDSKGKSFKGRNCAEKVNQEYRFMAADMYNLQPAVGSVNAARSNYNFTMLPSTPSSFGSCDFRIENRKVQPPARARGVIARTYMYMDSAYPKFSMSKQQKQLMTAWDKQYPVQANECRVAKEIEKVQGNQNEVVKSRCVIANMW